MRDDLSGTAGPSYIKMLDGKRVNLWEVLQRENEFCDKFYFYRKDDAELWVRMLLEYMGEAKVRKAIESTSTRVDDRKEYEDFYKNEDFKIYKDIVDLLGIKPCLVKRVKYEQRDYKRPKPDAKHCKECPRTNADIDREIARLRANLQEWAL